MTTWHEPAQSAARADEFAAIESYGLIGDGESVALVARDGAWATCPRGCPIWLALLNAAALLNGRWALASGQADHHQQQPQHQPHFSHTSTVTA